MKKNYGVLRGGSWAADRKLKRSAYRDWGDPDDWNNTIGFCYVKVKLI